MDTETIKTITRQIHRQFPELAGEQPVVRTQASAKSAGNATYLLTFKVRAASSGPNLARTVRVVADERGKVLKVTTSR
ncbi:MAG: hypothetical protein KIT70_07160 [Anaerolineales bacterium]|nr:MAG: hypothetical protein KIT70_07160 [Anaerolineales bacterium]